MGYQFDLNENNKKEKEKKEPHMRTRDVCTQKSSALSNRIRSHEFIIHPEKEDEKQWG